MGSFPLVMGLLWGKNLCSHQFVHSQNQKRKTKPFEITNFTLIVYSRKMERHHAMFYTQYHCATTIAPYNFEFQISYFKFTVRNFNRRTIWPWEQWTYLLIHRRNHLMENFFQMWTTTVAVFCNNFKYGYWQLNWHPI